MNVMRYTIVAELNTTSFVASCDSLSALVAACANNPRQLEEFLALTTLYDDNIAEYISCGLAVFDEHNVEGHYEVIHSALKYCLPQELPVFRVVDQETRKASLQPVKAGIVIFNLSAHRIIEMQNTYAGVRRRGKIVGHDSEGRRRVFRYELPANWAIVP
ncbi:MAG: hypothetical protein M0Z94_08915 [Dehalococcoidales bacterium]|nr:hypothetical protein [Dehalococcoidales bacterium]